MPTEDTEKRKMYSRRWYEKNRQRCIDGAKRRQDVQRWRAKRKAAGLRVNGDWDRRLREYVNAAAKRGREYWPAGCRVRAEKAKPERTRKPWHGLSDSEAYRVRYALDLAFAQRERERISARRFARPEYGAQWERCGHRWLRAAQSADGSVTREFLRLIRRETHCAYCGEPIKAKDRHLDHVWPLAKGGSHTADNLVMACADCNRRKRATLPLQWLMRMDSIAGPSRATPTGVVQSPIYL